MTTRRISLSSRLARSAALCLAVCALAFAAFGVAAQTIDDVAIGTQGADVVARVSLNATVRVLRLAPPTPAQLLRVEFELVAADESVTNQTNEESRNVRGIANAPDLSISYVAVPRTRVKQLTLQLSRPALVRARQGVDARSIELVFVGAATATLTAPAAPAPPIAPLTERRYAVTLQTVPANAPEKLLPVPVQFQAYEVFSVTVVVDGVQSVQVNLGYFETEEQAQRVRALALTRFPDAKVLDLVLHKEALLKSAAASTLAQVPAPATAPSPPVVPAPVVAPRPEVAPAPAAASAPVAPAPAVSPAAPLTDVDRRAAELLDKGRQALIAKNYDAAIDLLNQLLLLPPNPASKDAQELIGLAWERAGNVARARTEYQLYLKLFPEGEGAERVAQRLASLEGESVPAAPATQGGATAPTARATPPKTFTGSIAQYYYGGVARSESLVNVIAGVDQQTLSRTTQSAIVTSADLNARFVQPDAETRLVVRGTGATNLSSESHNSSLLNAAYVDYRRPESGLGLRAGRQSAISGGLLGLFDGVSVVYPIRSGLKVDVMGGVPANTLVNAPAQRLLAAMVEVDGLLDKWGGNVYVIDQTVESITNRRAIGAEVRYSSEDYSLYSLFDYDVNFKALNAVTLQGSIQAPGQTTITVLLDNRKAPSLQLTNALISTGQTSMKAYLDIAGNSLATARADALAITAIARQGLVSVSRPLAERWQIGADLRYSQIGALPAVGVFEATPATGAQVGGSLQLTGSNLYSSRDLSSFGLSVTRTPLFKGAQISYSNLTGVRDNSVTLEPSIRFYVQHSSDGLKLTRVTPGMRVSYRMSRRASLIGESIVEHSTSNGPSGHDTTNSVFFTVGYRYEFN